MTQSIIIYRNPVEQALWEGQYGEILFPLIVVGLYIGLSMYISFELIEKYVGWKNNNFMKKIALAVNLFVGCFIFYYMVF